MTTLLVRVAAVSMLLALGACSSAPDAARGGGGTGASGGSSGNGGSGNGPQGGTGGYGNPPSWPELEGFAVGDGAAQAGAPLAGPECLAANPTFAARVLDFVPTDANARGSAILAREALLAGRSPVPVHLRTQELLTHYAPRLATTTLTEPQLVIQLRSTDQVTGAFELMIGVETPSLAANARPPLALTLIVDTSASIAPVLGRTVSAIEALAGALGPGDVVSLVSSEPDGDTTQIVIDETPDQDLIDRAQALEANVPEELTPLNALITSGYALARSRVVSGSWNRVLVLTDGDGQIDELAHQAIKDAAMQDDIVTLALGVGVAFDPPPRVLRLLSHAGRGPYVHLDGDNAASLELQLTELLGKSYDQLRVQLQVPWYFEIERPYSFETTAPGTAEPQYLAPGQVAVFPFRLTACDKSMLNTEDTIHVTVGLSDALTGADATIVAMPKLGELISGSTHELAHVFAVLAYAEALRSMNSVRLERALELAIAANTAGDAGLNEITSLVTKHPGFPAGTTP